MAKWQNRYSIAVVCIFVVVIVLAYLAFYLNHVYANGSPSERCLH